MLNDLFAPLSCEEFLHRYWTDKEFVHIPGPLEKFAHLFSWDVLNRALEQQQFTPRRLQVVRTGRGLPEGRYLKDDRVNLPNLTKELAAGATLIFNACDESYAPLRDLCVLLERLFHVYVSVNLYAGWRHDNGFDVHWDRQDTLILQVSGRKHWKVWRPTRLNPFKDDVVDTSKATQPTTPPIWDGILEPGSMLNMPRGWWHVAYPMDEPCLHLTVTIKSLNGVDFLEWFVAQMKTSEYVRQDVQVFEHAHARRTWLRAVWHDLAAAWNDDLVERFLRAMDARAVPRPLSRLPALAAPASGAIREHTPLQLALPRALRFQTTNGIAHFHVAGVDWKTSSDLVPLLERFNDGLPHTVTELSDCRDPRLTAILTALVMSGALRSVAS